MQVELVEDDADMGERPATPPHEEESTPEHVSSGPHPPWIDVGHREGPTPEEYGDLMGVDAVVLGLAAVDGVHVEGMAEDEGDVVLGAENGEPVPAEDALGADDQMVPIRFDGTEEAIRLAAHVAVEDGLAGFVLRDAELHGPG